MPFGGRARRGWFRLGGETHLGRPDWKKGLYLGTELGSAHPRVAAGVPMHGKNLIPGDDVLPGLGATIFEWMAQLAAIGQRVIAGIARLLDLPADYFARRYTADPLIPLSHLQRPEPADPGGARRAPRRR